MLPVAYPAPRRAAGLLAWLTFCLALGALAAGRLPARAAGAAYYASPAGSDGTPGSQALPFREIRKAVSVAQPGDTVYVADGMYLGFDVRDFQGTAAAPLVIQALGTGAVVQKTNDRPDNRDTIL